MLKCCRRTRQNCSSSCLFTSFSFHVSLRNSSVCHFGRRRGQVGAIGKRGAVLRRAGLFIRGDGSLKVSLRQLLGADRSVDLMIDSIWLQWIDSAVGGISIFPEILPSGFVEVNLVAQVRGCGYLRKMSRRWSSEKRSRFQGGRLRSV